MAIVVQVFGVVMLLGGLVGLVYGIDMLPTERGIAGTISSTVALTGGVLTAALGVLIARVEAVKTALSQGPRAVAAPKIMVEETPRPRLEPVVTPPPVAPEMPAVEPLTPSVTMPEIKLPDIRLPDIRVPDVAPVEPKLAPPAEKPRFKLPSFRLGGGAAAAGAAAGALAGAAVAKAGDAVQETAEKAADAVAVALATAAPLAKPDPVDPPVEILTPVEDVPLADLKAEDVPPLLPEVDAAAYPHVPLPEAEPIAEKPVSDDPFAAFDAELDKLIPLRPARKAKGKKEPVLQEPAPEEPAPLAAEETVATEPMPEPEPIPAEVYADPADLEPPPPAPAPGADIVGAYESGGAKYTMYSDGSVVAEAEGQQLFFRSLEELRQFIDGGAKG